jgi:hypothetical protein
MKEIKIKILIDDEAIAEKVRVIYLLVMRTVAPIAYVIILILIRTISPSTHRNILRRTQSKKAVYTAEKHDFSFQKHQTFEPKNERVGGLNMHSSTMVKCGNPECDNLFEYAKRGNQEKKFCSSTCKDAVNNAKKMGNYYEKLL